MYAHELCKYTSSDDVDEIKLGGLPVSAKDLQPIVKLVRLILSRRGNLSDSEKQHFGDNGFTKQRLLQVATCISQTSIQNFSNNINKPKIDVENFKKVK